MIFVMHAWLITNGFMQSEKFNELSDLFIKEAKSLNIHLEHKKNSDIPVGAVTENVEKPQFVLFWDKDILLAGFLESLGIRVFNSSTCIEVCDDKRKTYLALKKEDIPTPDTMIVPMTYDTVGFTNYDFIEFAGERFGFPLVIKEAYGSFGEQVYLARNDTECKTIIQECHSFKLLFQQYIKESHGRDIRLQVVGNRVIGAMERYSDNDFRANITAGGNMRAYQPTADESKIAIQAACAVGADFAGVDLLFGKDGPLVCEVNSNAHFKNLMDCTGVNTAREILQYIVADIRGGKR